MPICQKCGAQVDEIDKFCHGCGTAIDVIVAKGEQRVSTTQGNREVIAIIPRIRKPKSFGLPDIYTMIFTADQAIFAKLTDEVVNDVLSQLRAQGQTESKGLVGRALDKIKAAVNTSLHYLDMAPERILAESKDNFVINHTSISSLKVKAVVISGDSDSPGDVEYTALEFETSSGKYKLKADKCSEEMMDTLRRFYGNKVKG